MTVYLVAGKVTSEFLKNVLSKKNSKGHFIGIDRGTLLLVKNGFTPEFGVGDFDSLNDEEKKYLKEKKIPVKILPKEKDDTDTQQGFLEAIKRYPEEDYVFLGGTGGRVDHFLANLYLPLEKRFFPYLRQMTFLDEKNNLTFYPPGSYVIKKIPEMTYLGYVGLTPLENLTLEKSKYTLNHVSTNHAVSYPSNEFVGDEAQFSFEKGVLAIIQSRD